jgi:hypothetical protein
LALFLEDDLIRGILCPSILEDVSTALRAFSNENFGLFIFFSFFEKNIIKKYYIRNL